MEKISNYEECCKYILDIPRFAAKNTLLDTHRILNRLYKEGSAKIIHIAGTNGKGSTTMFLSSILQGHGYKVGMFTSPHLVSMTERIKINGVDIKECDFYNCFQHVCEAVSKEGEDNHPSFFEFIFLMAMDYFSDNKVDYIILETGLGGRLDATNCIEDKCLSVITKIGFDHMEYLGNTIEAIAGEKAGIIKENVPLVFWDNKDISSEVIMSRAKSMNSMCYPISEDNTGLLSMTKHGIDFWFVCGYYKLDGLSLNVSARYQVNNASLAIRAAYVLLGNLADEDIIKASLKTAYWPGRMEEIGTNIFLDGAHNEDGIMALLNTIRSRDEYLFNGKKVNRNLLFSMVSDKEVSAVAGQILEADIFKKIYVTTIDSYRKTSIEELKKVFSVFDAKNTDIEYIKDLKEAYSKAVNEHSEDEELYMAGSLYLVGEIKGFIS